MRVKNIGIVKEIWFGGEFKEYIIIADAGKSIDVLRYFMCYYLK